MYVRRRRCSRAPRPARPQNPHALVHAVNLRVGSRAPSRVAPRHATPHQDWSWPAARAVRSSCTPYWAPVATSAEQLHRRALFRLCAFFFFLSLLADRYQWPILLPTKSLHSLLVFQCAQLVAGCVFLVTWLMQVHPMPSHCSEPVGPRSHTYPQPPYLALTTNRTSLYHCT